MKTVTILQPRLLHYRVELFESLKLKLQAQNIELNVIHGEASVKELSRQDIGTISWSTKVKNTYITMFGVDLLWQPIPKKEANCDLLILVQENKILSNYFYILKRKFFRQKTAYWGHGKNLQSMRPGGVKEQWKRTWLKSVDWWFAYTISTVNYLKQQGYSEMHITCLNNAIDTIQFRQELTQASDADQLRIATRLDLPKNACIGLYCGSLYKQKRLEFMIDAADLVKQRIPDFQLIIIGDGPDFSVLQEAAQSRKWIKLVGVQKGTEKAVYFKMAKIVFNPGMMGLHILDSFCAGLPTMTTDDAMHSPEYDYLVHGVNGLILKGNVKDFAIGVVDLLSNADEYNRMVSNILTDREKYTLEKMVDAFTIGINSCLNSAGKK